MRRRPPVADSSLRGARAAVLAIAAGMLAAVAQPPFGVLPGLLGYALMMHLADRAEGPRPLRSAFWRGWLGGARRTIW